MAGRCAATAKPVSGPGCLIADTAGSAIPPKTLAAILVRSRPVHSWFWVPGVPAISSITAAVSTDSCKPTMAMVSAGRAMMRSRALRTWGNWAEKIGTASAFTKPVRTELETKRISMPMRHRPKMICMTPISSSRGTLGAHSLRSRLGRGEKFMMRTDGPQDVKWIYCGPVRMVRTARLSSGYFISEQRANAFRTIARKLTRRRLGKLRLQVS